MILCTGGNGLLAKTLSNLDEDIISLSKEELDVRDMASVREVLDEYKPDIVIHAGAVTEGSKIEKNFLDRLQAIHVNIIGTSNVVMACMIRQIRLCYISSDYIYGNSNKGVPAYRHNENDPILPQNKYSWSKLGGECACQLYNKSLIIRTSFLSDLFQYDKIFDNCYTSKDRVSIIAPMILKAAKSDVTGILNIGTNRKSFECFAKEGAEIVNKELFNSYDFPEEMVLDTFKYQSLIGGVN